MSAEDVVIASAEAAASLVGTDRFLKMTTYALRLHGKEICGCLRGDEGPGLLAPADVVIDGKDRSGAILTLEDRAVIAWTVGTLRIQSFQEVVPYAEIASHQLTTRPAGAMSKEREVLEIVAGSRWELAFYNVFEGGRSIAPFLQGMIGGWAKPVFERSQANEEKIIEPE